MVRALARIDLAAVRANCVRLRGTLGRDSELCAVIKADGYGHGADGCASAALAGGASRLAVATAVEAAQVGRRFQHVPLLTMGALTPEEVDIVLSAGSEMAVWGEDFRRLLSDRARAQGRPARVHVKYDSGMGRLGNADPGQVLALARACAADPDLELAGSGPTSPQLMNPTQTSLTSSSRRFEAVAAAVRGRVSRRLSHAANSAAVFRDRAHTSTWLAAASRSMGSTHSRGPGRARPGAGALAALLRRRREALRGRQQRRLRAALAGSRANLGRGRAARLRRRAFVAASPTTPRSWSGGRRHPWSAPSRWTTSPSISAPTPR